jgi:hypothetical protein
LRFVTTGEAWSQSTPSQKDSEGRAEGSSGDSSSDVGEAVHDMVQQRH